MLGHGRDELHQRDEDDEQEDSDESEEEAEEAEEDNEQEDTQPTREELEFLKLREKLKDQIRKNLKKQSASMSGHIGQSQDKRTMNDKFGSFFGPSKPVIAQRVLEESRSIRETQHIVARGSSSSCSNKKLPTSAPVDRRTNEHYQKPKPVNEVKKKAQTLKDMRDYSFLLSDDTELPAPTKVQQPAPRDVLVRSSDTKSVYAPLKGKIQSSKPALASNGHNYKSSVSTNQYTQGKVGSAKDASVSRLKALSAISGKKPGGSVGSGPTGPLVHKALPCRGPQATSANKHPTKVTRDDSLEKKPSSLKSHSSKHQNQYNLEKKPSLVKPHSSKQNHYSEQKRVSQGSEKVKPTVKQPLPSSRAQPSKPIPPRGIPENHLKKRPVKRDLDEEDDPDNIHLMIRKMFGYNPRKYVDDDDDDSDMEVGFDTIQKEELRSSRIAQKEDEEELRRILEEEERERERARRKKQRLQ